MSLSCFYLDDILIYSFDIIHLGQTHIHSTYRRVTKVCADPVPDTLTPFPQDLTDDILGVRNFLEDTLCVPNPGRFLLLKNASYKCVKNFNHNLLKLYRKQSLACYMHVTFLTNVKMYTNIYSLVYVGLGCIIRSR